MRTRLLLALGSLLVVGGCTTGSGVSGSSGGSGSAGANSSTAPNSPTTSSPATSAPVTSSPTTSSPPVSAAQQILDAMTPAERVGQLLMVDCPSTQLSAQTVDAIGRLHVGSVILDGNSEAGAAATRQLTGELEDANPSPAKLFIATDQEGGLVRRLRGSGFSDIPSGLDQGGAAPQQLQADWRGWGEELHDAGVNVDLAPVLDTVPAGSGPNPPIGDLDRQYGSTPKAVSAHGLAAMRGLDAAGVAPTVKHFPGLGRVTGNTDTTAGVTDTVTTRDDPYLAPFRAAVQADVPFVMMSTATYARIDPAHPAAFSAKIVTGLLRDQLGFSGVVISDDLGAAAQVADLSPGERAVAFVRAGGDVVLTVSPSTVGPMVDALVSRARSDKAFAGLVDAAALRVLTAKQRYGLLP